MLQNRKFDEKKYKEVDGYCKRVITKFYTTILGAKLKSDLDKELYKEGDLVMEFNGVDHSIELECRKWGHFNAIKRGIYKTIHIPSRKDHLNFDTYVVLSEDCTEMFILKKAKIQKYLKNQVESNCSDDRGDYREKFIDVPTQEAIYYFYNKSEKKWFKNQTFSLFAL